jgi:hypothetical protein
MYNYVVTPATATKLAKLAELIFSDPVTYGNWNEADFGYWFEGLTEGEMVEFLEEIITEGDSWLSE